MGGGMAAKRECFSLSASRSSPATPGPILGRPEHREASAEMRLASAEHSSGHSKYWRARAHPGIPGPWQVASDFAIRWPNPLLSEHSAPVQDLPNAHILLPSVHRLSWPPCESAR